MAEKTDAQSMQGDYTSTRWVVTTEIQKWTKYPHTRQILALLHRGNLSKSKSMKLIEKIYEKSNMG